MLRAGRWNVPGEVSNESLSSPGMKLTGSPAPTCCCSGLVLVGFINKRPRQKFISGEIKGGEQEWLTFSIFLLLRWCFSCYTTSLPCLQEEVSPFSPKDLPNILISSAKSALFHRFSWVWKRADGVNIKLHGPHSDMVSQVFWSRTHVPSGWICLSSTPATAVTQRVEPWKKKKKKGIQNLREICAF